MWLITFHKHKRKITFHREDFNLYEDAIKRFNCLKNMPECDLIKLYECNLIDEELKI